MYIYHVLNALSSHMIHINLNMIFYTHVEHSPTKQPTQSKIRKGNAHPPTYTKTTMNLNVYDTDRYLYIIHAHAHTHHTFPASLWIMKENPLDQEPLLFSDHPKN